MKSFNGVRLTNVLIVFIAGINSVKCAASQPIDKDIKTEKLLPPEVFPKQDLNDSIPIHLQGELPPKIFPDDKAPVHADFISNDRARTYINATKDTEQHDKANKTSADNRTTKVASEIPDLLNSDYMNVTVYEDRTDNPINNDTETVEGPHVVKDNKTHDEDATTVQRNCSLNETTRDNSTLENECLTGVTGNNQTTTETHSTDKIELTTEAETNIQNLTTSEPGENITGTVQSKNEDLTTLEYNTTVEYSIEHNTTVSTIENVNPTVEAHSKSDDKTEFVDKSTTPSSNESVVIGTNETVTATTAASNQTDAAAKQTSTENNTVTELPSAKVETTSVNISENIIDHKSSSLVALAASQQHAEHAHGSSGKSSAFLQPTESAAILAGVFVGIALLGYVGLLVWRRILEKRYGNREMLVNEDDFYDPNDLRNFEL